jgi:[ribosomal protein S18]-alanine N-acetyltransferase
MMLRPVTDDDAPMLAAIHAQCFCETWNTDAIRDLLAMPGAFGFADTEGLGFILVRAAGGESEVLTLAVAPAARRRGIAKELVLVAAGHAANAGAAIMFLEVCATNLPALALYSQLGFAEVARRKAYYAGPHGVREDALVLRAVIPLARMGNSLQLG